MSLEHAKLPRLIEKNEAKAAEPETFVKKLGRKLKGKKK